MSGAVVTGPARNPPGNYADLTGRRFGMLVALEATGGRLHGHVVWLCLCDCCRRALVASSNLTSGNTRSCGCHQGRQHVSP